MPSAPGDGWAGTLKSGLLIVVVVELVKACATFRLVGRQSSRKLMHIVVGPVFLLTWAFFEADQARDAAAVPLMMTVKFGATGLGWLRGKQAKAEVKAMSRSGKKEELLRGPLLYGLTFWAFTWFHFKQLVAAVALMNLCVGDGLAELVGASFLGAKKLPWSPRKSWAGSAAFVVGAFGGSYAYAELFFRWGWSEASAATLTVPLLVASVAGAAVESLPMKDVDNVLVPLAVAFAMRHFDHDS